MLSAGVVGCIRQLRSCMQLRAGARAVQGCSSVLFFEARKKKDLYVWLAKAPEGPSVKFYVTNGAPCFLQHAPAVCTCAE